MARARVAEANKGIGKPLVGGAFHLTDHNGKDFSDADLKGKYSLVYFGFTHCPDACPMALQTMAAARDLLGPAAGQVALVFITLDPERDTPEVMRDYAAAFGPEVSALTGGADAVAQAAKAYRVFSAKVPTKDGGYTVDHTSIVYAMDPRGRFAANFTHETPPEGMAARLRALM